MPVRRRLVGSLAAVPLALVLMLAPGPIPTIVVACSCMASDDPVRDAAADPNAVVFTGLIQGRIAGGVQVAVTRWFTGTGAGPIVALDELGFEDPMGGMCGTTEPPAGSEWLFVSARNERGMYDVNLCTPHAELSTDPGARMLASANALYGPGTVADPGGGGPGDAPQPANDVPVPLIVGGTLGAGILVFLIAAVVRRRTGSGQVS